MRIKTLSLTAGAAFCICAALGAQSPPTKVGVISMQEAIVKTKDGQSAAQQLDAKFQPRQKEFDRRQNELAQLQDQFNKGGSVLSEEKRTGLLRDIDQKKKTLERDVADAKDELAATEQDAFQGVGQRIKTLLDKYAKDGGYAVILDYGNQAASILYASTAIDVTQDIIALYDKANPVSSSAATPSAGKPAVYPK
jgi:outer membrane protein